MHKRCVFISIAVAVLVGPPAASSAASGLCDQKAAQSLVGKVKPTDAEAMRVSGATIVRQVVPGQPVTEDYRENRVTIETDPTTGRVVRAMCG